MGGLGLLAWYVIMFAISLGPAGFLWLRWGKQDTLRHQVAARGGMGQPHLEKSAKVVRALFTFAALALGLFLVAPLHKATPALTIALGYGYLLEED